MKSFAVMMAALLAVVFSAGASTAAPPDNVILLQVTGTDKPPMPPVPFEHAKHGKFRCTACHHQDAAGSERKCSECHLRFAAGPKPELKIAFHKTCMECHKAVEKGPIACRGCHQK